MDDTSTTLAAGSASHSVLFKRSDLSLSLSTPEIIWLVVVVVVVVAVFTVVICVLCRCKGRRIRGKRRCRGTSVDDGRNDFATWNKSGPLPVPPEEVEMTVAEARQEQLDNFPAPPQAHIAQQPRQSVLVEQGEERRKSRYYAFDLRRVSHIGHAF